MEPTFVVIGISYRTAALAVRERFWMDEADRTKALSTLIRSEGVDEVVVFSSCNRTEFYLWTQNASDAANSVLRFLTRVYDLKLSDWSNFYRLMGEAAITHVFRVAAALDTQVYGESEVVPSLTNAWYQAQKANTTGCFLDAIVGHALEIAGEFARKEKQHNAIISVAQAAVQQCHELFPDVSSRQALVIGAGKLAESVILELRKSGLKNIKITNRTSQRVERLASVLKVEVIPFEQRWAVAAQSDIVAVATSAKKMIVARSEIQSAMKGREERPLAVLDIGVPRNVDPSTRVLNSVYVFDIDDLSECVRTRVPANPLLAKSEDAIRAQAARFNSKLLSERVVPTITALRERLQDLCEQELSALSDQFGPFTEDQNQAMHAYAAHIAQRISSTIARQLRGLPGEAGDDQLADTIGKILGTQYSSMATAQPVAKA